MVLADPSRTLDSGRNITQRNFDLGVWADPLTHKLVRQMDEHSSEFFLQNTFSLTKNGCYAMEDSATSEHVPDLTSATKRPCLGHIHRHAVNFLNRVAPIDKEVIVVVNHPH